eukprot:3285454-Alexandrium_andersonii.AAC.1
MSASLVGSEMCIRDRGASSSSGAAAPARAAPAQGEPGEQTGQAEPAVSYTHLTLPTICSV